MLMATPCNRPCSWATGPRRSIRKAMTGTNTATEMQIATETCPCTKTDWVPSSKHGSLSGKTTTAKQWAAQSNHSKVATLETRGRFWNWGTLDNHGIVHWKWTMIWSITWVIISLGHPMSWLSSRAPYDETCRCDFSALYCSNVWVACYHCSNWDLMRPICGRFPSLTSIFSRSELARI